MELGGKRRECSLGLKKIPLLAESCQVEQLDSWAQSQEVGLQAGPRSW